MPPPHDPDTAADRWFDDVARMAAEACDCAVAMLRLPDRDLHWRRTEPELPQMAFPDSLCAHVLAGEPDALVVPDTGDVGHPDDGFPAGCSTDAAPETTRARFFAGVPLRDVRGQPIGVLCVADRQPRGLSAPQVFTLKALAVSVTARLEQQQAIGDRDRALLAQQRTAARSREILDSAIDYAIISSDLDGRVLSWNEGARRVLGWTEAEMLGKPADRIFTPEDVAAGRPAVEMAEALGAGRGNDERWHMREDGSRFFASGEMMLLRDDTGTAVGFLKILRDRTEQRIAGTALRNGQERIDTALGTGLMGFFDWDVASGLVLGDGPFAELCGLDPAILDRGAVLDRLVDAIHPDDRAAVTAAVRNATAGCGDFVAQFRTGDGRAKAQSLLMHGRCVLCARDRALRFTGIVIDVSAVTQAREALRVNETFTSQVMLSSSDCIKVLSLDGNLVFMSEGGQQTMEIDDFGAFVGCPWPNFWEGPGNALARAALETARAGGRGHFQGPADTARGNPRYWDVVVTPISGADGQPERLLSISRDITEARMASERIELALNAGAVLGTWVWDVQRDLFTADSRFAATFSLDPVSMVAGVPLRRVLQSIHPADASQAEALISKAMADGSRYSAEFRVRQPDGCWRWIEANGSCEMDGQGVAIRFPGVLIDIDERKRQELLQAALVQLGDQMRALRDPASITTIASRILGEALGVARAGYGSVDPVHSTIEVAEDWRSGAAVVSVTGHHHFRTFGSYIENLERNQVVAIADVELDPRTSTEREAWRSLRVRGLLNVPLMDDGRLAALVLAHVAEPHEWTADEIGFARAVADRTWAAIEQARVEAELIRINEGLEALVAERTHERDGVWKASQDLLCVTDHDGIILSVNPAWTERLGWRREEIVGRTSDWLQHPADPADPSVRVGQQVAGHRTAEFENRMRTRDGGYRTLSWVVVPVEGKMFCSARDVTEQKEAAETLARTEQALRQSQKMEAVGQLTGGIAHDFNNLLTGIIGALELLGTRVSQRRYSELGRYTEAAQGAARRAAALTHRLLAFSRQQTLDPKPTDAERLVGGMEELIRRTVGPEIELDVTAAEDLWPTLVDPHQLENAVLNLCINARDAMPDGGRLSIAMANVTLDDRAVHDRDMPPGHYMAIAVTDTGTGMSPDVIAKAFDPFFTTKPLGQGTGLGLSMIYGFARQSGGQVRIHSQLGMGTTMRLYLPRHAGAVMEADAVPQLADVPRARAGETVLVVDDEPTIRMLVVEVLQGLGYAAIEAADGAAGLDVLRSNARIDLLVTDVGLPGGMNGRQMADVARTSRPGLKVLFITGYAATAVIGSGHLDPGMHVMTKPFAMEALAGRIKELIAGA